jgi:3-phenylpropionate/cinnamic acid dioxygenase small subunit
MNRSTLIALLLLASSPLFAGTRELSDRAAITDVMHKYVWAVDSLDADGYASVFTPDAQIDSNGVLIRGHEAIRRVVTDQITRQAANRAEGKPAGRLYHVISNERIELINRNEAVYRSYWQTLRRGADNRYATGGFGTSEDHLVKRNGRWLIALRKLTVFTE